MKQLVRAVRAGVGVLSFFASLAGLTFAATGPEGKPWLAWGVGAVSISFLVFLLVLVGPAMSTGLRRLGDIVARLRNYSRLEGKITQLEEAWALAKGERDEAREELSTVADRLVAERKAGYMDMVGDVRALLSDAQLVPIGATVTDGALRIVAQVGNGHMPLVGSRFLAQTSTLGSPRGVAAVVNTDPQSRRVQLAIAQTSEGSESFWVDVKHSAERNERAPDLELVADPKIRELFVRTEE